MHSIDGHVHVMDKELKPTEVIYNSRVAFIDIEPSYWEDYKDCLPIYDKYIQWAQGRSDVHDILLATAITPENIIQIREKYKDIIKGYGELKCYTSWKGKDTGRDLQYYIPLFEYNKKDNLPIYIHWTLFDNQRVNDLEKVLKAYPSTPFVLCHCGMGNTMDFQRYNIYSNIILLMSHHRNLYVDISFDAMWFFTNNPERLLSLDTDRCILGSDINPVLERSDKYEKERKRIITTMFDLDKYVNSDKAIQTIFKI